MLSPATASRPGAPCPVLAALDGVPGWEAKLSRFVTRWVDRSEDLLRTRAAGLNARC